MRWFRLTMRCNMGLVSRTRSETYKGLPPLHHYTVYGITVATDFPFTWPLVPADRPADLRFELVSESPIEVAWRDLPPRYRIPSGESEPPAVTYHRLEGLHTSPDAADRSIQPSSRSHGRSAALEGRPVAGTDIIRIHRVADHFLFPDRIVCHLHNPEYTYLVEIQLLGVVLALWLERRGIPVLHGSCGVIDGRAVAFLGRKGSGKTTLAAGLLATGHALLTDDLLALDATGSEVRAQPGYPMLRLEPDQINRFVGTAGSFPKVHPRFTKRAVPVGPDFGRFHPEPAPLHRVFLPERIGDWNAADGDPPTIEPAAPDRALLALVGHSYLEEEVHALGLAGSRFRRLAGLLDRGMGVYRLRYPNGFEHVPAVVAAVEAHCQRWESVPPSV